METGICTRHTSTVLPPTSNGGLAVSYRLSVLVDVDKVKGTGKTSGGKEKKIILDDVYGRAAPGHLLAIMGPSGAGKTTLLNCLSLRNKSFRGCVLHNDQLPDMDNIGITSAFVQQEDLFIPTLTPREHLAFHATMRMEGSMSKEDRCKTVDKALEELGLVKCADTLIGGQGSAIRGISGGEKKRLSFATEMLSNSPIVFADEPTSGLDSFMAESVVLKLRSLAEQGKTAVATIHQPSSQVFSLFTHLHLLSEGRTAYFGPLPEAVQYFEGVGHPCPSFFNPADHYIHVLSQDPNSPDESSARISAVTQAYSGSAFAMELAGALPSEARLQDGVGDDGVDVGNQGASGERRVEKGRGRRVYQASWVTQFHEVYVRTILMYRREPVLTRVRVVQAVAVAVIVGLIYLQLGNTQTDVQSTSGLLFFVVINQSILGTIGVLQVFPLEMPVFLREYDSGAYRVETYFLGRTLAEIPIQIAFPALHAAILYPLVGLPFSVEPFFLFISLVTLTANAAVSLGYVVSALANSVEIALALGPMVLMPMIIFGGLLVNVDEIPPYFLWYSSLSFIKYGYGGVSIAIWREKDNLVCPPEPEICPYPDGLAVLDSLNIHEDDLALCYIALVILLFGFRFLAYLALIYRARPSGKRGY